MRTTEQIVARIKEESDLFNTAFTDLAPYVPFAAVRDMVKADFAAKIDRGEEVWKQEPIDRDSIVRKMREYMTFALEKAENHRGLSASRSVDHYCNWLWLLEDTLLDDDRIPFVQYGVPMLKAVGEKYGFPMPVGESWYDRMSAGKHCGGNYACGCRE